MKPRFEIPLADGVDEVFGRLKRLLRAHPDRVTGQVLKDHAFVALPRDQRSLLSPYLNLSIYCKNDGRLVLVGRFSPHPHVWTGFMATYGAIGFLGMCGLVYGWARTLIGQSGTLMWAFPVSLALIAFVWGAAVIGQGLAADQMYILRRVVDQAAGCCDEDPEEGNPAGPDGEAMKTD